MSVTTRQSLERVYSAAKSLILVVDYKGGSADLDINSQVLWDAIYKLEDEINVLKSSEDDEL